MSDLSCPKCSGPRDVKALYCPFCGIVFSRYDPDAPEAPPARRPPRRAAVTEIPPPPPDAFGEEPAADVEGLYNPDLYNDDGGGLYNPAAYGHGGASSDNPYAPPSASVAPRRSQLLTGTHVLAGRGTRLLARILDGLIMVAIVVVGVLPGLGDSEELAGGGLLLMGLGMLALMCVNLYLMAQAGQTIGKKLLNIRVVRTSGEDASLGRLVGLRVISMNLLGSIPYLGALIGLINVLMIFADDQRCMHDHIADTKVVVA